VIAFGPETCRDFRVATRLEWLESNGIGGYASSTICLANTRRYHGLLVAALDPPGGRTLLLAKLEESLVVGQERFDLAANQYHETVHPEGHRYLDGFRLDPYPIFTYRVPGALLEKGLFLVHGANTLIVLYRLTGYRPVFLEVRPLIAYRAFHDLGLERDRFDRTLHDSGGVLRIEPVRGLPPLHVAHGGAFRPDGYWYRGFEYVEEAYRGYDFREDLYSPGTWTRLLEPGRETALVVSTEDPTAIDPAAARTQEWARRDRVVSDAGMAGETGRALALASDQLLVRGRGAGAALVVGYPWFPQAGREAAIAVPGIAIATGRHAEARDVIRHLLAHAEGGLLPVAFAEDGGGGPTTHAGADPSLWLFVAAHEYLRAAGGDDAFVRDEIAAPLLDLLRAYLDGSASGIEVTPDGLIRTVLPGVPLTWMNARVNEWVATERAGMPVEVEALWVNALRIGAEIAALAGRAADAARFEELAARATASFGARFWDAAAGFLRDASGTSPDGSLRPNQVIALGLPYPVLGEEETRRALRVVREKLWTPCGLRTLASADPRYRGRYVGDSWLREGAYHQGTVWPWLLGPYLRAVARAEGRRAARLAARPSLEFLRAHLTQAGLGAVSEIFDGDPPHTPRGAISSLLSAAEFVRVVKAFESE
jgi:predicted glycogen debranching enzyme